MSNTAKMLGLAAAILMFGVCAYVYIRTGDWVAAVFALGSLGWGGFFLYQGGGKSQ